MKLKILNMEYEKKNNIKRQSFISKKCKRHFQGIIWGVISTIIMQKKSKTILNYKINCFRNLIKLEKFKLIFFDKMEPF